MGWKTRVFAHLFLAKTHRECLKCSVYFCTDLSAKMGVSIDVYFISNLILIFGTRFWKSTISMQFWIFATTLTRRPPDWWCDRQHQYGGQKIQVAAVAFRVHFMQSHRSPMPLSNFFTKRRRGPWCGASVGTTGSAPRAHACCPWSVMRGLCWKHWFRPLCACVLPDLSRIYDGFIRIRVRSRRSGENTVKNVYEMETGFMPDLCRIYSHFQLFKEERRKKRVE